MQPLPRPESVQEGYFINCQTKSAGLSPHEIEVVKRATHEVIKKLREKFPAKDISERNVTFKNISEMNFSNSSLGINRVGAALMACTPGYIVSFNYANKEYNMHTPVRATYFDSNDFSEDAIKRPLGRK